MTPIPKPFRKPANPRFSTGPCTKPPGWTLDVLGNAVLGRSHRSDQGRARLRQAIEETHSLLELPADYRVGIVPASDTGAMEMAMWSLLGERGVEVLAWESFGLDWLRDVATQLDLDPVVHKCPYGSLPRLERVDFSRDVVLVWNGTTSGVRIPDGAFIPDDREGLVICDATSAAFAVALPWNKLDAVTFSWQKVLGGEGAHGMLVLSPRAVARLESHVPSWPIPKIFRLTKSGKLNEAIFDGATINTPSLLCVEDFLHSLAWGRSVGGLEGLIARANANAAAVAAFVSSRDWIDFLARDEATRSNTSLCLSFTGAFAAPDRAKQLSAGIVKRLANEEVAYDIVPYPAAPPGLRIWCGGTVETADIEILLEWIEWAYKMETQPHPGE